MCIEEEKTTSYKIIATSTKDECILVMSGIAGNPQEEPKGNCS